MPATSTTTTFTYTLDGQSWELPLIGDLPPYLLQGLEDEAKPLTGLRAILDEYAPARPKSKDAPERPALFRSLRNATDINDLMEAWQKASGVTVGESSASAGS